MSRWCKLTPALQHMAFVPHSTGVQDHHPHTETWCLTMSGTSLHAASCLCSTSSTMLEQCVQHCHATTLAPLKTALLRPLRLLSHNVNGSLIRDSGRLSSQGSALPHLHWLLGLPG